MAARKIHISTSTKEKLDKLNSDWIVEERGTIEVKGKGQMKTFWLLGRAHPQKLSLPESEVNEPEDNHN